MYLVAPIVPLIQREFCWGEVKGGKCGLEVRKRFLEKESVIPGAGIVAVRAV